MCLLSTHNTKRASDVGPESELDDKDAWDRKNSHMLSQDSKRHMDNSSEDSLDLGAPPDTCIDTGFINFGAFSVGGNSVQGMSDHMRSTRENECESAEGMHNYVTSNSRRLGTHLLTASQSPEQAQEWMTRSAPGEAESERDAFGLRAFGLASTSQVRAA